MSDELKNIVSDEIKSLTPYPPGKPIEEVEREYGIQGSIKLASNENPLGPSPKAVEAISKSINNLHRYPDGSCYYLKRKLAEYLKVKPEMLIIGNGSNEILDFVVKTFLGPSEEAVMGDPSFAVYPIIVKASRGKPIQVPLKDLTHDLDAISEAVTPKTRLVFIANPNNPTGTIVTRDDLDIFLGKLPDRVIVVMDEAYREYVTDKEFPNSLEYIESGRYMIILRTFSKIYGLAGLRIGYGIACKDMVSYMEKVRQPFNVNSLAQIAAEAALDDEGHLRRSIENNTNEMNRLFRELEALGFKCVPSQANFFLIKVGQGSDVYEGLLRNGIIVRPMDSYGLSEYIRVTVGLPEENKRFIKTFRTVTET
jgi:histidinol-phosphate aminotransferase